MELNSRDLYVLYFCGYPLSLLGVNPKDLNNFPDPPEIKYLTIKLLNQRTHKSIDICSYLLIYLAAHGNLDFEEHSADEDLRLGCLLELLSVQDQVSSSISHQLKKEAESIYSRFHNIRERDPVSLMVKGYDKLIPANQYTPEINDKWRVYGGVVMDKGLAGVLSSSN